MLGIAYQYYLSMLTTTYHLRCKRKRAYLCWRGNSRLRRSVKRTGRIPSQGRRSRKTDVSHPIPAATVRQPADSTRLPNLGEGNCTLHKVGEPDGPTRLPNNRCATYCCLQFGDRLIRHGCQTSWIPWPVPSTLKNRMIRVGSQTSRHSCRFPRRTHAQGPDRHHSASCRRFRAIGPLRTDWRTVKKERHRKPQK